MWKPGRDEGHAVVNVENARFGYDLFYHADVVGVISRFLCDEGVGVGGGEGSGEGFGVGGCGRVEGVEDESCLGACKLENVLGFD